MMDPELEVKLDLILRNQKQLSEQLKHIDDRIYNLKHRIIPMHEQDIDPDKILLK